MTKKARSQARKPSTKIKVKSPTKHVKRLGTRGIKRKLIDTIEAIVADTPPEHQLEVAEHVCDIGIDLLGLVTGVDASNALVMFPDDGIARLLELIHQRESDTQVSCEQIIEQLIKHLANETLIPTVN